VHIFDVSLEEGILQWQCGHREGTLDLEVIDIFRGDLIR
jgi:hypothetical protein